MQWWYVKDGQRKGPVEEDVLKAMLREGSLSRDDLAWNASMGNDWRKLGDIEGLAYDDAGTPEVTAAAAGPGPGFTASSNGTRISLTAPVEAAWAGTKKILFSPFDLGKWFALGFSAWLASLMENGGSFNFNSGRGGDAASAEFQRTMGGVVNAWNEWQGIIIGSIVALVLIGFVLGVVLLWVKSRGKFMFLDNVVHNRDAVKVPWREFSEHGNSLFKWTLGLSVVMLLVFLVLFGGAFVGIIKPCIDAKGFVSSTIPVIVIIAVAWIGIAVVGGYIVRFLDDFIVPVMYRKDMTASEAWSFFGKIYGANKGKFILYGLFYVLLGMGAGAIVLLATVLTCCILGCLAAIPYLGTVALLPVQVFFRLYSLHYFAQYGGDCDLVTGSECSN